MGHNMTRNISESIGNSTVIGATSMTKGKPKKVSKAWNWALAAIVLLIFGFIGLIQINRWYDKNYLHFEFPVHVRLSAPIQVWERKAPQVVEKLVLPDYPGEIDTPIKKYICDKFGAYDCKTALAIVQAESGFNDQAFNANSNDSVDLGCWQINFPTHLKTISPIEALDCYKATDWAFEKYKRDGNFNAWVAYSTGSYLASIEK